MARFLLVGKGGYGDVLPLLAIAQALLQRGHQVRMAGDAHHGDACADIGIELIALTPGDSAGAGGLLGHTLQLRGLDADIAHLTELAHDADLLIGNQLAYAAAMVCERLGKPWVYCPASPLSLPSACDPPLWPFVQRAQRAARCVGVPEAAWTLLARIGTRALMWRHMQLRHRLGLPVWPHPRFEAMYSSRLNLLPVSSLLVSPQSDWPANTLVTGFAWHRTRFVGNAQQAQAIQAFAQAGEPPIVFAPGGDVRARPEAFVAQSLAACRQMHCRAIVVVAPRHHPAVSPDPDRVFFSGYQPYADVFEHARAVVHSGGIGTLGWALRAGQPSLLVPSAWDQFDNAQRAQRLGVAHVLAPRHYRADHIVPALRALLEDATVHQRVARLRPCVAAEDGAQRAADALEDLIHEGRTAAVSE